MQPIKTSSLTTFVPAAAFTRDGSDVKAISPEDKCASLCQKLKRVFQENLVQYMTQCLIASFPKDSVHLRFYQLEEVFYFEEAYAIAKWAAGHLEQAAAALLRLINRGVVLYPEYDGLPSEIIFKFMKKVPCHINISELLSAIDKEYPIDYDELSTLGKVATVHAVRFLSTQPENELNRELLYLNILPQMCLEWPEVAIEYLRKEVGQFLLLLSKLKDNSGDRQVLFTWFKEREFKKYETLQLLLYDAPSKLFSFYLQKRPQKPLGDEVVLLDGFFSLFASLGEGKIAYTHYSGLLLEESKWLVEHKNSFDVASIVTCLSFTSGSTPEEWELKLFGDLISPAVLKELPKSFWNGRHLVSFLQVILQQIDRIPSVVYMELVMNRSLPQELQRSIKQKVAIWREACSYLCMSEEDKTVVFLKAVRTIISLLALPKPYSDNLEYRLLTTFLRYIVYLREKEDWTIVDCQEIHLEALLEIAQFLLPNDYKLLIPLCGDKLEALFRALQEDEMYEFSGLAWMRFVNRMPSIRADMPVEEVFYDYAYYYEDFKAIREVGLYEARYPGKSVSDLYHCLFDRLLDIIEFYPAKDSDFEKAMVGFERYAIREEGPRKL